MCHCGESLAVCCNFGCLQWSLHVNVWRVEPDNEIEIPLQLLTYQALQVEPKNGLEAFKMASCEPDLLVREVSALDFESGNNLYVLEVTIFDDGLTFGLPDFLNVSARVTVQVTDENEAPTLGHYSMEILEDSPEDTFIGFVKGNDQDAGQTKNLTYSILDGDYYNLFKLVPIPPEQGGDAKLTVRRDGIDYEAMKFHDLVIVVEDTDTPKLSSKGSFFVKV